MSAVFDWTVHHPLHAIGWLVFVLSMCGMLSEVIQTIRERNVTRILEAQVKLSESEATSKPEQNPATPQGE